MGGAMVLGRGRRRESGAENGCNGNCKFCLAQHFYLLVERRDFACPFATNTGRDTVNAVVKCAHAPNPTMHRTSPANTATFNIASIMLPSTESRLPFEVLICRRPEIFPARAPP
jgi:hypothetical protein